MEYRALGRWGVKVSVISLGTWLSHGGRVAEDSAIAYTQRAYELGVNLFDTANEYQHGHAEDVLGKALAGLQRDSYLVASKVCYPMGEGPLDSGLSRKHIMAQIDQSLGRLGMDHIDLYQCHDFDVETPMDETAQAMTDLIRAGKILYWGVSNWSSDQLTRITDMCREEGFALPVSDQPQYSALWREIETEVLPTCDRVGMGVLAWSPLAMGVLTGKYKPGVKRPEGTRGQLRVGKADWLLDRFFSPGVLEAVEDFRMLAEETGYTAAQLALGWCLRNAGVSSVIVGASKMSQLQETLAVGDLAMDPEVVEKAGTILAPVAVG